MKKFLSLVLALVMTMSLVTVSAGAKDYADADKITYVEAVDVLSALGVLEGDANGFRPTDTLKRSEAAKIICALNLTPKTAATLSADAAPFADVAKSHWAAGYIAEGVDSGILAGVGGNKFAPDAELTGYAYLKMLLVSLGYDAAIEGMTGANWSVNVAKLAKKAGLTDGNDDFVGSAAVTREEAALYALNTLQAFTVSYDHKGTTVTVNGIEIATGASAAKVSDTEQYMDVKYSRLSPKSEEDAYGRPAVEWVYKGETIGTYAEEPVLVYTESVKGKDIKADLKAEGYKYNSAKKAEITNDTYKDITGNGKVVEFYAATVTGDADTADVDYIAKVVEINTYIAEVKDVKSDRASTKDTDESEIKLDGVTLPGLAIEDDNVVANFDELYEEVEEGDYILYTVSVNTADEGEKSNSYIVTAEIAESVEGKITRVGNDEIILDGETYELAAGKTKADFKLGKTTVYLDSYGYAILCGDVKTEKSDAVYLTAIFSETDKWDDTTYTAQIVTAEGEVEELVLDAKKLTIDEDGKVTNPTTLQLYTYTTEDDEATLTPVAASTGKDGYKDLEGADLTDSAYVKVGTAKVYYADEVTMVYMKKVGTAKMSVTTADDVEKYNNLPAGSFAVLNDEGDIETIFVADEAMTVVDSDNIIYIDDATSVAEEDDNYIYEAYINGEKKEIAVDKKDTVTVGFYTYSITDDVYDLTKVDTKKLATVTDVYRDTYLNVVVDGKVVEGDFVLDDDAVVIDLSENDITDAADLKSVMDDLAEDGKTLTVKVVYDLDDEVVTVMVVK